MKFLRNRSLKQLSILLAIGLFIAIVAEILFLKNHFTKIEAIHQQVDFARTVQLTNQRLSLTVDQAIRNPGLKSKMLALVDENDFNLNILENGGRIPGSDIFLGKLQRLPSITFTNLKSLWDKYKATLQKFEPTEEYGVITQAQSLNLASWYTRLTNDLYDEVERAQNQFTVLLISFLIINGLLLAGCIVLFNRYVINPLKFIGANTVSHNHTNGLPKNEIGIVAGQINDVIEQLRDATDFVKAIGEGKLDMDYRAELDPNYEPGKNKLADELIDMQGKLLALNTDEQRRKWANEGLTKLVDILRNSNDNLTELGDKIISTLVQYTDANQGGLYILNDDDERNKHLELVSLFAFNIKKFEKQHVKLGEGILGQTFLEKETTYLTNIPEEYVRITSGLGDAAPKSILFVPLKVDREVYGIVELASFKEFLPHEISFVEKLGETIASTLSSVKINQKNRKLLEQFKVQTEQMRAQEEEMRQNMEELTATQEGMHRLVKEAQDKEEYLNNLMDASPDAIVAIGRDYRVVLRNNARLFQQFIEQGIPYEKGFYVLGLFKNDEFDYHKSIYDRAFNGEVITVTKEYFGKKYSISYNPLHASSGEIIGVSIFAHDETELAALKTQLSTLENTYQEKIKVLEAAATAPPSEEDRWSLAAEVEKTFRIQLEALKITQEQLGKKHP
jgi:putative methionine-R-sulfoxide reductase with GAF domain